jgi:hypothetical protein
MAALLLAGCLERVETITVELDGTVVIEAVFKSDQLDELFEGDAMPSEAGGWLVEDVEEIDDEGGHHYSLFADSVFGPQSELPENYAVAGDPDTELYLQFPTSVTIEPRPDGVYYHFHRTYPGRAWARIEALRELLIDEPTKGLKDKDESQYTPEDRKLLVRSYTDFETAKLLTFARHAYLATTPDRPQDAWLDVIADFDRLKGELDLDRIADLMDIEDEDERQEALDREVDSWEENSYKTLQTALREACGYEGTMMKTFMLLYANQLKDYDITAGLGDDGFEITVVMPGEIVGSNADTVFLDRATWKFSGRRFRDRDVELMVSSRSDL